MKRSLAGPTAAAEPNRWAAAYGRKYLEKRLNGDMDKLRSALSVIVNSLRDIINFWPRVLARALISSIISWFTIGFAGFIFIFVAYLIANAKGENMQLVDFFPAYYLPAAAVVLVLFFLYLTFHESARLYSVSKQLSDKYNRNNIRIRKKEVFTNKRFWSYYIEISNQKQYDLGDVIIEMRYIEVNGNPIWYQDENDEDYKRPRLAQTGGHGHNWHSSLIKKGDMCDLILLDTKKEDGRRYIPLYTPYRYQEGNISGWRSKYSPLTINEYAKGEINILIKIDNQSILGDCIYNFSIILGKTNPTIRLRKGNISQYLHPKLSNEVSDQ